MYSQFKIILFLSFTFLLFGAGFAQESKIVRIKYNNQDIRSLAEEYFGDPNLWEVILNYNNIENITGLKEGREILLPVGLVKGTLSLLNEVQQTIKKAVENGAKVFTPELLSGATEKLEEAIKFKEKIDWLQSNAMLREALYLAKTSLEQSQLLRHQSADATISYRVGNVQNRKAAATNWIDAKQFAKLYEEDRTRTLTESFAEITFIDLSRIRLNENSQAVIKSSRVDLLANKTETKVQLVKGDAFAYLLKSPKKKFDIDVPGLDSRIQSKNFWIEKQDESTKFANYEGEIELKVKDSVVVIKENQGSVIPRGGFPSPAQNLLPSPIVISPANGSGFYISSVEFNWSKTEGAYSYWLELASDQSFNKVVYSNKLISSTKQVVNSLAPGIYYWHICSIDNFGFPGNFGNYNYIHVIKDENKPFLRIISPDNQLITKNDEINIIGETETGCNVEINNEHIDLNADASFTRTMKLSEGRNLIEITSRDKAGNFSSYKRNVFFESDPNIINTIFSSNYRVDNKRITTNLYSLNFKAQTRPLSQIKFSSDVTDEQSFIYADTNGFYSKNILLNNHSKKIYLEIISAAGYSLSDTLEIFIDNDPPKIELISKVPRNTAEGELKVEGQVIGADTLLINGEDVGIKAGTFSKNIELTEGENQLGIIAVDAAGNRTEKSFVVLLDVTPPVLSGKQIEIVKNNSSGQLIRIFASDISSMKKTARATIVSEKGTFNEVMKLNESKGCYELLFESGSGSVITGITITLEDYLNNKKEYTIKN